MTDLPPNSTDEEAAQSLARRLREQRTFLNLTQQFVAEQTGIPRSAISDIERGARRVDSLELKRLAALYRMPIDYFVGGEMQPDLDSAQDPTLQALTRTANKMGPEEKEQVLRFATFLQNYERQKREPK
ncbi:MAG: helix-turn-helix domain-containing protein [Candidatus Dormibacteraceae bacterium]